MNKKTSTTAYLKVYSQNFATQTIKGEVCAGSFHWDFIWSFSNGTLTIEPPLGRALIQDALLRFLIKSDYYLEPGSDYNFIIRAKF
ncbi:DUF3146 family protein [Prochlorococcus marinus]|uniref:DUF3146 family protein n=1 Tax=Prochlorococcus marinus TaxID=1219 RepID=UPI0022B4D73F|nr:DUF3146 family protein [Prochlorococcus marinus]